MVRRWLVCGIMLGAIVPFAMARQGVVRTKDGRSIEGDVVDAGADGVNITTRAGAVTISRAEIESIQYSVNIREVYQQRLAALPADAGAKAHVELARWLYESKAYDLADREVDAALAKDPASSDAQMLRTSIRRAIEFERSRTSTPALDPRRAVTRPSTAGEKKLLNADQINVIKQLELRKNENFRVRFEKDVKNRFARSQGQGSAAELASLPDPVKAMVIMEKGTPEMRRDVRIVDDPGPLAYYKRTIQPMIIAGCGSNACHGGANAGQFVLHTAVTNDAASYTNFYYLTQYSKMIGGIEYKAINRVRPQDSLLIQFGLPRDVASPKHPDVPGFAPMFRGGDDKIRLVDGWMGQALLPLEPDYGIDMPLPFNKEPPASQPAPAEEAPPVAPATSPAAPEKKPDPGDTRGGIDDALKRATGGARPVGIN
jgi:hypothetical protein